MTKRPTVVLHLIESAGPGGAETVVLDLCKRTKAAGIVPLMATLRQRESWLPKALADVGIETFSLENRYPLDPILLWRLAKLVRDRRVDVIHSHEFTMNVYGTVVASLLGIPNICTAHGKGYPFERARRRVAYRWAVNHATHFVAVSEDLKRFIIEQLSVDAQAVTVVYNGIDTAVYDSAAARLPPAVEGVSELTEGRRRWPIIGSVGNLYPVKGYPILLQAAVRVIREYPDALFLVIGKTNTAHADFLKAEVTRLGLSGHVRFLGFREDVVALLSFLDLFVLPSLSEGVSLAVLQAMSSRLPVIVSRVGGNVEVVEDDQSGLLFPSENARSLAEKMSHLLRDPDRRHQLGDAARQRVEATFSIDTMFGRYLSLYTTPRK